MNEQTDWNDPFRERNDSNETLIIHWMNEVIQMLHERTESNDPNISYFKRTADLSYILKHWNVIWPIEIPHSLQPFQVLKWTNTFKGSKCSMNLLSQVIQMSHEGADFSDPNVLWTNWFNTYYSLNRRNDSNDPKFNERTNSNECSMNELTQMFQIYHDLKEQRTYRSFWNIELYFV